MDGSSLATRKRNVPEINTDEHSPWEVQICMYQVTGSTSIEAFLGALSISLDAILETHTRVVAIDL